MIVGPGAHGYRRVSPGIVMNSLLTNYQNWRGCFPEVAHGGPRAS